MGPDRLNRVLDEHARVRQAIAKHVRPDPRQPPPARHTGCKALSPHQHGATLWQHLCHGRINLRGKGRPDRARIGVQRSGLYYCRHDGSLIREAAHGFLGLNGVGLSPDETIVYAAETWTSKLWAFEVTGEGTVARGPFIAPARCVCTQPGHVYFDSLAVQANGDICVATLLDGGITVITPEGDGKHVSFPDMMVTNICFGGPDMRDAYLTLSGKGLLIKTRWPEAGLRLNVASYSTAYSRN
jgi:sugar lactone lactonase YvrE